MMTFGKRALALALSCALLLMGVTGVLPTTAQEGAVTFTRLEAEEYGTANLYNDLNQTYGSMSGGHCVGGMVGPASDKANWQNWQTYASLSEYLDKSTTPYVAYTVVAAEAGDYAVRVGYLLSTKDPAHYMTVLVNDRPYKAPFQAVSDGSNLSSSALTVTLKAGANVIRCIPYVYDIKEQVSSGYLNQDYLDIDARLTGVKPAAPIRLEAETATYFNRFNVAGDHLGGAQSTHMREAGATIDGLTVKNLSDVSYFAYTVEAPHDGYYDMTVTFNTDWATRDAYFGLMADGQVQARRYRWRYENAGYSNNRADFSTFLSKGTHVLVFTAQMPKSDATQTYKWTDFDSLTLYGGLTKAEKQQNPLLVVPLGMTRLEAEAYGTINLYNSPHEANGSMSGGQCVGGCDLDYDHLQSYDSLHEYLDKSLTPYVSYTVYAEQAGDYALRVGFYLQSGSADHYMTVLVNGQPYKAPFKALSEGSQLSASEIEVPLVAGNNVIRCIPFTYDTKDEAGKAGNWLNQDYLDIDARLTGIKPTSVRLEAEAAPYYNRFRIIDGARLGDSQSAHMRTVGATIDALTVDNLHDVSYFAYTVEAPEAGYYDMTVHFNVDWAVRDGYFGLMVDGQVQARRYRWRYEGAGFDNNKADFTTYLAKGSHVLVFTAQMPLSDATQTYKWTDFDALTLHGGLKAAEEQVNPVTLGNMVRLEAEDYAQRNRYDKTETGTIYSAGKAVGGGGYNDARVQTEEQMRERFDTNYMPHVVYTVDANEAGTYTIRVAYSFGTASQAVPAEYTPYIYVYANGKPYKAPFLSAPGAVDIVSLQVELQQGRNTILCSAYSKETRDAMDAACWVNQDYVEIPDTLTAVRPEEPVSKQYTRLEAEIYGTVNLYSTPQEANAGASGGYYVGGCDLDYNRMQTYDSLHEYLDKSLTPYVSYTVYAQEAGTYALRVGYYLSTGNSTHYMTVLVNDQEPYPAYFQSETRDSLHAASEIEVSLDAGVNVIRCIPYTYDTREEAQAGWLNQDYLDIDPRLMAVEPTSVRLEAEEAPYLNRFSVLGGYLGNSQTSHMQLAGATIDTLTVDNLYEVSYFAYTVEAPEDGFYDLTVNFNVDWAVRDAYFGLMVDGRVEAKHYRWKYEQKSDVDFSLNKADFSTHLTKGAHILVFTAQMPQSDATQTYKWTDFDALTLHGGLKEAEEQVNPITLGHMVRLEAEEYAEWSRYNAAETGRSYSGGKVVGGGVYDNAHVQTEEQMKGKLDETYMPYIAYMVETDRAGTYPIRVAYSFGTNSQAVPAAYTPYIYVYVNGKPYKAPYTLSPGGMEIAALEVEMQEGRNTILVSAYSKETLDAMNANCWVNHDYLDIPDTLTAVKPAGVEPESPEYTRFEAETYGACNLYRRRQTSGQLSGGTMNAALNYQTAQTLAGIRENGLDAGSTPFVEYTLDAPAAGEYRMRVGMQIAHEGDTFPASGKVTMVLWVNGNLQVLETDIYSNRNKNATFVETVALKKGRNYVRITTCTADAVSADGLSAAYANQDYLDVSGSVTATPVGTRMEAEYSDLNNYIASADGSASNGMSARNEYYQDVYDRQITIDKLDETTWLYAPYVAYKVVAPQAGTYHVTVGFNSRLGGTVNTMPLYFAMVVNGGQPQKVTYTEGYNLTRVVPVELAQGENTILVTGALCEFLNLPRSSGGLVWIDHDYLELPDGLSGVQNEREDSGVGDEQANLDDPQLVVGKPEPTEPGTEPSREDTPDTGDHGRLPALAALLAGGATGAVLSRRRKKKYAVR